MSANSSHISSLTPVLYFPFAALIILHCQLFLLHHTAAMPDHQSHDKAQQGDDRDASLGASKMALIHSHLVFLGTQAREGEIRMAA